MQGVNRRPIIQVANVTIGHEGETLLENLCFEVYEGEIFAVLGGSGCGKSTLLKHLIGLMLPQTGHITIDGIQITGCNEEALRQVQQRIGVLFQSGALFGSMTIADNVALPIRQYTVLPEEAITTLVRMKLHQVNLNGYETYLPSELSGGMKKRAGLARAIALSPKILFFDEPSAGLDPILAAELDHLIVHINATLGTTMVIVTHDLQSIFTVAQRVIVLDRVTKSIIAHGNPLQLRDESTDPFVRGFFHRQPL
ncbi:MAG: ATP-binding cassette domain-containing protein [Desulfobacterota bacterium]|nr:ATP-binding cassette domain-containing protein [Thermodesulfobacteriota bacterium]